MPESDWRPLVILGGIVTAIALTVAYAKFTNYQGHHVEERIEATQNDAGARTEQGQATCGPVAEGGGFSCTFNVEEPNASDPYAKYDLRAQQEMAEWALALLIATISGLIVTIIGLYYIVQAYRLNAAATDYARLAANAATQQATIANQALAASQRPWLAVDDVRLKEFKYEPDRRHATITVVIWLRNTGQSPAQSVQISCGVTADFNPSEPSRLQGEMRALMKMNPVIPILSQTIFPGSAPRDNEWSVSIGREQFEEIEANYARMQIPTLDKLHFLPTLYGVVAYRSPHDKEIHTTGFMVSYLSADGRLMSVGMAPPHPLFFEGPIQGRTMFGGWDAD